MGKEHPIKEVILFLRANPGSTVPDMRLYGIPRANWAIKKLYGDGAVKPKNGLKWYLTW